MELKPFYRILSYGSGSYKASLHMTMMKKLETEGYGKAIICPEGENINQWVAIHMVFFFNDINLLYGAVQEKCTNYSCPFMSAGVNFEYLWADKYKYKNPTRVPAKTYIDYLMNWIVKLLEDERLFPPNIDSVFPKNYVDKVKNIAKRYFRVYAHVFYSHLEVLRKTGIEKMFYDSLTYFLLFIDMYSLVPSTDLRPLSTLIYRLVPDLKITRLLNQSEEENRQMKQKVVGQKTPGHSNSHTASIDGTERNSGSSSRDEHSDRSPPIVGSIPISHRPNTGYQIAMTDSTAETVTETQSQPISHVATASSSSTASMGYIAGRPGSAKRPMSSGRPNSGQRPGSSTGVSNSGISNNTGNSLYGGNAMGERNVMMSENISSMGIATMSQEQQQEKKINWDDVMKASGSVVQGPASYAGVTEGEENCECVIM